MGDFKPAEVWAQDAEAHVKVIDGLLAGRGAIKHGWVSDSGILGMPAQSLVAMGGMPDAEDSCIEAVQILKRMEVEDMRLSFVDKSLVETLRRVLYNISLRQGQTGETGPTSSVGPTGAKAPPAAPGGTSLLSMIERFVHNAVSKTRRRKNACDRRASNARVSTSHRLKLLPRR